MTYVWLSRLLRPTTRPGGPSYAVVALSLPTIACNAPDVLRTEAALAAFVQEWFWGGDVWRVTLDGRPEVAWELPSST